MTATDFEAQLRQLERQAVLVRRRRDRETWRFDYNAKPYFLHFYPDRRGAAAEFAGLKTLQDFKVPAVRAAAFLSGFQFGDRKGDAIITHGIEGAVRLDEWAARSDAGAGAAAHRAAVDQVIDLLKQLAAHKLGHEDLRLSSFLWSEGRLHLCDAAGLTTGGLKTDHLMGLAFDAGAAATMADRLRVWRALVPGAETPPNDKHMARRIRQALRRDAIERIDIGEWSGRFRSRSMREAAWSPASRLNVSPADWRREWPALVARLRADQLEILKRDRSGDVLADGVTLAGVPIDVVVKRPRNKFWYRYVYDLFRVSRAMRLWQKARWLQARQIAVEYPLIVMERRRLGYVVESIALFEKVPGPTLDAIDLDALSAAERETLFRRCGHVLRRIEDTGLTHTDAKSSNWIIVDRTTPVLIDAYGLRPLNSFLQLFGIHRLLRAMRKHPQYTPTDSRHLCQGFAPRAPLEVDLGA
ncbi:MAG: lipopolysaccharide kinase InaA family protein [Tepidisphaeraceae bacterium]